MDRLCQCLGSTLGHCGTAQMPKRAMHSHICIQMSNQSLGIQGAVCAEGCAASALTAWSALVCRVKRGELDGTDLRSAHMTAGEGAKRGTLAASVVHHTAEISSLTRENPRDVIAWLSYAAQQPHAIASSGIFHLKTAACFRSARPPK